MTRLVGALDASTLATVRPSTCSLRTDQMLVAEGGDLGQVGHHQHLMLPAQGGQRLADGDGRLAADAGVDLVEDEGAPVVGTGRPGGSDRCRRSARWNRLAEHQSHGQHGPGQLAARRDLGQGQQTARRGWRRATR